MSSSFSLVNRAPKQNAQEYARNARKLQAPTMCKSCKKRCAMARCGGRALFGQHCPRNQPPVRVHLPSPAFTAKTSVRYTSHPVVLTSSRSLHHHTSTCLDAQDQLINLLLPWESARRRCVGDERRGRRKVLMSCRAPCTANAYLQITTMCIRICARRNL